MDDLRNKNRIYAYIIYATAVIILILSVFSYNAIEIVISASLLLLSVAYMNSGHLINYALLKNLRIIEMSENYRIAGNMRSAVKRGRMSYKSVSVAILKPSSKIESSSSVFEDIINKVKIPFEFSIALNKLDRKKVMEGLETRRRMKELELAQGGGPDYKNANILKRQIGTIENEIAIISDGDEPVEALLKLKSFAEADSESEAARTSLSQLEHVANLVASAFKLDYVVAMGEDILDLL